MESKHLKYIDSLRVIACFFVVTMHTSGIDFDNDVVSRVIDCISQYAVQIFVAISGACFIGIEMINNKKIYNKIVNICISYLLWSMFYLCINEKSNIFSLPLSNIFLRVIAGNYHMYFLRMIIFLYLLLPIINLIYKNKKLYVYLIIYVLMTSVFFDQYIQYIQGNDGALRFLQRMHFAFRPSLFIYFLLGALLRDIKINTKHKNIFLFFSILSIIIGTMSAIYGRGFNSRNLFIMALGGGETITFASVFYVIGIFVLFKIIDCNIFSSKISKYTFGIYMIHPFIISLLFSSVFHISTLRSEYSIIDVIINIIAVFGVSLLFTFLGSKLPFINKHMFLIK